MTAFAQTGGDYTFLIMIVIACILLYLGIVKKYEPLLLIPIGMGVLLANFPGGGMGVSQATSEGLVTLPDGTQEVIWDMPLHKIAHELGLMNFIYYMCIKTGFIPPIIFMGLGFSLHFFTIQKSWTKYFKMAAILCITFIFDAILAYMIGKHLHEMEVIIGTAALESQYGFAEAVTDINTWAVIFCGFIVYIIWGIVFDMTMSAYDQLDLNKININAIDDQIKTIETEIADEKQKEQDLNNQINGHNNAISQLTSQIGDTYIIDKAAIRTEMTNFFTGWAAQMNVLGKSLQEQAEANVTFENTINALLN